MYIREDIFMTSILKFLQFKLMFKDHKIWKLCKYTVLCHRYKLFENVGGKVRVIPMQEFNPVPEKIIITITVMAICSLFRIRFFAKGIFFFTFVLQVNNSSSK